MSRMDKRGYDDATEVIRQYMVTINLGKDVSILMHKTSKFERNHYKLYIHYKEDDPSIHIQKISDFDKYIQKYLNVRFHMRLFEVSPLDRPILDVNTTIVDLEEVRGSLKDSYSILKYEIVNTKNTVVLSTYEKFITG